MAVAGRQCSYTTAPQESRESDSPLAGGAVAGWREQHEEGYLTGMVRQHAGGA